MPRGNGTGPEGKGPMTGRGAGFCEGNDVPGYRSGEAGRGLGRGFGWGGGRGGGRPWRNRFRGRGFGWMGLGWGRGAVDANEDPPREKRFLRRQLDEIKRRLSELGEEGAEK